MKTNISLGKADIIILLGLTCLLTAAVKIIIGFFREK